MIADIQIVPENPAADGKAAGKRIGKTRLAAQTAKLLKGKYVSETLGEMSRAAMTSYVMSRLETPPDTLRYPELEDLYPERIEYLRGFAEGAGASLQDAAVHQYLTYRAEIDHWYYGYQLRRQPGHCSGVLMAGPDGVLGAHSVDAGTKVPRPKNYHHRTPPTMNGQLLKSFAPNVRKLVLKRPRTGYIAGWGTTNEKGVGIACGNSCGVWLDEPIEDVWPLQDFPLKRFARDIRHLEELYKRYTLYLWNRSSQIWTDLTGEAIVVEKSFRRIGIRRMNPKGPRVLWCTEGHFESPEMGTYIREKRLEYLSRTSSHLGAEDMQYATDCAVRFTRLAELCHQPWGRGLKHMQRILTDHAPFPRAICRHCGPDTAAYDRTVTQHSVIHDFTHNRQRLRRWDPWKKFCCEVQEEITQYPPRP